MPPPPTLVASDAHLGAAPEASERRFLDFLATVPELGDDLLLAGDLFDFWFGYREVVISRHFRVLRLLAELVEAGVRVRLVGGNHDAWFGSFLEDELGVEPLSGPLITEVGGRRTYLAHGDGLAGGDRGYRLLRSVVRARPARSLFRFLPPDLALPLVRRFSRTGRDAAPPPGEGRRKHRARALSEHAERLLAGDPALDLVIFGHSHVPELREVEKGRHYLNPGDWIGSFTYARVSPSEIELRRWEGA